MFVGSSNLMCPIMEDMYTFYFLLMLKARAFCFCLRAGRHPLGPWGLLAGMPQYGDPD